MSEKKQQTAYEPVPESSWMEFILSKLFPRSIAVPPPPLPDDHLKTLGKGIGQSAFNDPDNLTYYTEQITLPEGRLGRMLMPEEKDRLLEILMQTMRGNANVR